MSGGYIEFPNLFDLLDDDGLERAEYLWKHNEETGRAEPYKTGRKIPTPAGQKLLDFIRSHLTE